ncbi:MAG: hypothetical protein IPH13_08860 [Planctomycetes bacterium]|nr:hypothetical protein [Planctomycetota bacterium]
MAITLSDIMALRADKNLFARVDKLVESRAAAIKAAEAARSDLAKAEAELRELGIDVSGGAGKRGAGGAATGRKGGVPSARGPGRPAKDQSARVSAATAGGEGGSSVGNGKSHAAGGGRKTTADYAAALDEVGAEFAKAGKTDITGPDIFAAMSKRGFTSKQVVMNQARAHKAWTMKGVKRGARYFYKG